VEPCRAAGGLAFEPSHRPVPPVASLARVPAADSLRADSLRRTPLWERHRDAGARLVDFAGWEMPVQYEGVGPEHLAVRREAGIFDVSHMGEIETAGPQALQFLQRVLSNDVERMPVGGAQYSLLCREDGGILDDLFTYRLEADRFLTVTNASRHADDLAWLTSHAADFDVELADRLEDYAMLAVQGPLARELVQAIADAALPPRMAAARRVLGGRAALVCGTGYTGEDGVEILCEPDDAAALWDDLVRRGAVPAGLGARDTLRLEACFPLYGNDISERRNPIEAGLGWAAREQTGFVGADAVARARAQGTAERLVPFRFTGPGVPRAGNPVIEGGVVTSGTMSPSLRVGVGLAYLPAERAATGTAFEVDVRGKRRPAQVAAKPLVAPSSP
jgi:aminomethyltransferase